MLVGIFTHLAFGTALAKETAAVPAFLGLAITSETPALPVGIPSQLELSISGGAPLTGARLEARLGRKCEAEGEDLGGELYLARTATQVVTLVSGADGLRILREVELETSGQVVLPGWGRVLLLTPDRLWSLDARLGQVLAERTVSAAPIWAQPDEGRVWLGGEGFLPGELDAPGITAETHGRLAAFSADSHWMFIADGPHLSTLDTWSGKVVRRIDTGADVTAMVWSRVRESLYLTQADGSLLAFDLGDELPRARLRTAPGPTGLHLAPDGRHLYVRAPTSRAVAVIDTARDVMLREAHLWAAPEALVFAGEHAWVHLSTGVLLRAPLDTRARATGADAEATRATEVAAAGWTLVPTQNPQGSGMLASSGGGGVLVARGGQVCAVPEGGCVDVPGVLQVDPLGSAITEPAPGRYAVPVTLTTPGEYTVVVSLASPQLTSCISLVALAPESP
jgi:hypothetical protein